MTVLLRHVMMKPKNLQMHKGGFTMKFRLDHDLHIHSLLTPCAGYDPRQTKEAILSYGIASGLRLLSVADHVWDEKAPHSEECNWSWEHIGCTLERGKSLLPLPQSPHCKFIFGAEVDMDLGGNLAVSAEEMEKLDFIVIAVSHLHLGDFTVPGDLDPSAEVHKELYLKRMHALLDMDLPWHKTGLAHPTCSLACAKEPVRMFDLITDAEYREMWTKVRDRGMGIEINHGGTISKEDLPHILRPYQIAKEVGCKFYLGGDAHTPDDIPSILPNWQRFVDWLDLQEEDKLPFVHEMLKKEK